MKEAFLEKFGYKEEGWTVDYAGRFICPHGNAVEPDLRTGHGDCGCSSPMAQEGF